MEMLVTLVIVSFVTTLLSQALFQTARVERLLDSQTFHAQTIALRMYWLRQTLESLVPFDSSQKDMFRGDAQSLQGLSTQVPGWPDSTSGPFSVEFTYDKEQQQGRLLLWLERVEGLSTGRSIKLLEWQGKAGRIQYLGADGAWTESWPPVSLQPGASRLPQAISLQTGSDDFPVIVVAPLPGGQPRVTRSQIETF